MTFKKKAKPLFFEYEVKSDFNVLGRVLASPNKKKILYSLSFPKTLKEITTHTDLNFPTISKAIKELEILELITINNKRYRKGKIVCLSDKGLDVIDDLKKRVEEIGKD